MAAPSHRYAAKALQEILRQSESDADRDALDAIRYRYLRDIGFIFFQKVGAEVDRMVDCKMWESK